MSNFLEVFWVAVDTSIGWIGSFLPGQTGEPTYVKIHHLPDPAEMLINCEMSFDASLVNEERKNYLKAVEKIFDILKADPFNTDIEEELFFKTSIDGFEIVSSSPEISVTPYDNLFAIKNLSEQRITIVDAARFLYPIRNTYIPQTRILTAYAFFDSLPDSGTRSSYITLLREVVTFTSELFIAFRDNSLDVDRYFDSKKVEEAASEYYCEQCLDEFTALLKDIKAQMEVLRSVN